MYSYSINSIYLLDILHILYFGTHGELLLSKIISYISLAIRYLDTSENQFQKEKCDKYKLIIKKINF